MKLFYPRVVLFRAGIVSKKGESNSFYSQFGQDFFISKLLHHRDGIYVDVGANRPIHNNNTYYFEEKLNWSGIAIDPIKVYNDEWQELRPRTAIVNKAISYISEPINFLFASGPDGWEDQLSSIASSKRQSGSLLFDQAVVQGDRLDTILRQCNLRSGDIDVMSLDIEGSELAAIHTLGIYRPKFIILENNRPFWGSFRYRQALSNIGYTLIARAWTSDDIFMYQ